MSSNDNLLNKLSGIEERYSELNNMLMDVGDDYHRAASVSLEEAPFRTISSFPGHSNLSITQFYLQKLENRQDSSWLKVAALLEL
jgi:hypothetical protein